jgi:transposase
MPKIQTKLNQKQKQELKVIVSNSQSSGREVRRSQAVLLLDSGLEIKVITTATDYRRRQIFEIRKNYLCFGKAAIVDKRKGKPKELLTKKQLSEVIKLVKTKRPKDVDTYFHDDEFWSTGILSKFIERHYEIKYKSKTSYYIIFREAKFTFHKPGRVYEKHNDEEVTEWKKENEPKIFKALNDDDTIVLTEDEMVLSTQTTFQKIWLPQGEYPRVEISNTRKNRSVYGFLNIKTGKEHAFKTEKQNMFITVGILKKIRAIYGNKKLLIIWDGAGWHRGSEVQNFIKQDKMIESIHFPRYAPELNPQEHVWKSGRDHCTHNHFIDNIDTATDDFISFLNNQKFQYSLIGFGASL